MDVEEREARLRAAARDIRRSADAFGQRHTAADPGSGEEWDRGQLLSHLVEMLDYWVDELERVVAKHDGVEPFGRTKETPSRLERIESGRHDAVAAQLDAIDAGVERAVGFMRGLAAPDWEVVGVHPRLGPMTVADSVERFIVAHMEEHREQLAG